MKQLTTVMTMISLLVTLTSNGQSPPKSKCKLDRSKLPTQYCSVYDNCKVCEAQLLDDIKQSKQLLDWVKKENANKYPTGRDVGTPVNIRVNTPPTYGTPYTRPLVQPSRSTLITVSPIHTSPYETTILVRRSGGNK